MRLLLYVLLFSLAPVFTGSLTPAFARANTVYDTIAFLLFEIQLSDSLRKDPYFKVEVISDDNHLNYKASSPEVIFADLYITQPENCIFNISGLLSNGDTAINTNYEVDFRGMLPTKDQSNLKVANSDQSSRISIKVPGVKVCSHGQSSQPFGENFPPEGECWNYMQTVAVSSEMNLERLMAAMDYLRRNFCSGKP